jgi:hypothetical protein
MTVIENQTLANGIVALDDRIFMNCTYENCLLLYSGGDVDFKAAVFRNCRFEFPGAAGRTIYILRTFGLIPQSFSDGSPQATTGPHKTIQ